MIKRTPRSLVLMFVVFCASSAICMAETPSPERMLRDLRWRDALLDNVSVSVTIHEVIHRDPFGEWMTDSFNSTRFGGKPLPEPNNTEPYDVERVSQRRLTLRGDETTIDFSSEQDGRGDPLGYVYRVRSSDRTGKVLVLLHHENERELWIRESESYGLFYEHRRMLEFVLGLGIGSRLRSVESVVPNGDGWLIEATMTFWGPDVTKATLHVDRDLIVRKSRLLTTNENGQWLTVVTTSGAIEAGAELRVAESATYEYKGIAAFVDGKTIERESLREKFSTSAHRVIWDLTETKYRQLVEVDVDSADRVRDHTKKEKP